VRLTCRVCNEPFAVERSGRGRFPLTCSDACRTTRAAARPRHEFNRTCIVCFARFATINRVTRCCGRQCGGVLGKRIGDARRKANAEARRTRNCERCGEPFREGRRSAKQIAEGSRQRFCGRACATAAVRKYASRAEAKRAQRQRAKCAPVGEAER
jgi:hypothetical protein